MPKGDNKVTINFTTEMKQFGDSKKGDLYLSFFTALAFLERYKDEFITKYGEECYDAHIKRYSIPAIEVRNNATQRKKDALEQRRHELEIREKELAVKTKFLNAEAQIMSDKHETKEEREEKRQARIRLGEISRLEIELEQCLRLSTSAYAQKRIPELKAQIATLKGEPIPAQTMQPIQTEPKPKSQQQPHP